MPDRAHRPLAANPPYLADLLSIRQGEEAPSPVRGPGVRAASDLLWHAIAGVAGIAHHGAVVGDTVGPGTAGRRQYAGRARGSADQTTAAVGAPAFTATPATSPRSLIAMAEAES